MKKFGIVLVALMMVAGVAFAATDTSTVELKANIAGVTEFKLAESALTTGTFEGATDVDLKVYTVTAGTAFAQDVYYNVKSNEKVSFTVAANATDLVNQTSGVEYSVPVTAAIESGAGALSFNGVESVKSTKVALSTTLPTNAPAGDYLSTVTFTVTAD